MSQSDIKDIKVLFQSPGSVSTTEYLATIVGSYWEETTLICGYGTECKQLLNDKLVLCSTCDHWYHITCEKIDGKIPRIFKCKKCIA